MAVVCYNGALIGGVALVGSYAFVHDDNEFFILISIACLLLCGVLIGVLLGYKLFLCTQFAAVDPLDKHSVQGATSTPAEENGEAAAALAGGNGGKYRTPFTPSARTLQSPSTAAARGGTEGNSAMSQVSIGSPAVPSPVALAVDIPQQQQPPQQQQVRVGWAAGYASPSMSASTGSRRVWNASIVPANNATADVATTAATAAAAGSGAASSVPGRPRLSMQSAARAPSPILSRHLRNNSSGTGSPASSRATTHTHAQRPSPVLLRNGSLQHIQLAQQFSSDTTAEQTGTHKAVEQSPVFHVIISSPIDETMQMQPQPASQVSSEAALHGSSSEEQTHTVGSSSDPNAVAATPTTAAAGNDSALM